MIKLAGDEHQSGHRPPHHRQRQRQQQQPYQPSTLPQHLALAFLSDILCILFVILLAITGAIYLFKPYYENWQESQYHGLSVTQEALLPNQQIAAGLAEIPEGKFAQLSLAASRR